MTSSRLTTDKHSILKSSETNINRRPTLPRQHTQIDNRCTCCPYGYHVDIDFLQYLESMGGDPKLLLNRKKEILQSSHDLPNNNASVSQNICTETHFTGGTVRSPISQLSSYPRSSSNQATLNYPVTSPPTSPVSSPLSPQERNNNNTNAALSKRSNSSTVYDQVIEERRKRVLDSIDLQPMNMTKAPLVKLKDARNYSATNNEQYTNTNNNKASPSLNKDNANLIDCHSIPQNISKVKKIELSPIKSPSKNNVSTSMNIKLKEAPNNDCSETANKSTSSCTTTHTHVKHHNHNIDELSLEAIRKQMTLTLQRMKELEEQVKVIPSLQVRISSLNQENRSLTCRLNEANEKITRNCTSMDTSRHLTTEERNQKLRTVYLNSVNREPNNTNALDNKISTRSIGVGGTIANELVGEKEQCVNCSNKEVKTLLVTSSATSANNTSAMSGNHNKSLPKVSTRNVGIMCKNGSRDVAVQFDFKSGGGSNQGQGEDDDPTQLQDMWRTSTEINNQLTTLQQMNLAAFQSKHVHIKFEDLREIIDTVLKKDVHSAGIQTDIIQQKDVSIMHTGMSEKSVGCGDDSINVLVRPEVVMKNVACEIRTIMQNRAVNTRTLPGINMTTQTICSPAKKLCSRSTITSPSTTQISVSTSTNSVSKSDTSTFTEYRIFKNTQQIKDIATCTKVTPRNHVGVNTSTAVKSVVPTSEICTMTECRVKTTNNSTNTMPTHATTLHSTTTAPSDTDTCTSGDTSIYSKKPNCTPSLHGPIDYRNQSFNHQISPGTSSSATDDTVIENSHIGYHKTQYGGQKTHSEGQNIHSDGLNTHSERQNTQSEGQTTRSDGLNTHSEGQTIRSEGQNISSEGQTIRSEGQTTHSEGQTTHSKCKASTTNTHCRMSATELNCNCSPSSQTMYTIETVQCKGTDDPLHCAKDKDKQLRSDSETYFEVMTDSEGYKQLRPVVNSFDISQSPTSVFPDAETISTDSNLGTTSPTNTTSNSTTSTTTRTIPCSSNTTRIITTSSIPIIAQVSSSRTTEQRPITPKSIMKHTKNYSSGNSISKNVVESHGSNKKSSVLRFSGSTKTTNIEPFSDVKVIRNELDQNRGFKNESECVENLSFSSNSSSSDDDDDDAGSYDGASYDGRLGYIRYTQSSSSKDVKKDRNVKSESNKDLSNECENKEDQHKQVTPDEMANDLEQEISANSAIESLIDEDSGDIEPLTEEMESACRIYSTWHRDSTTINTKQLNQAKQCLQENWFDVASLKHSDYCQVRRLMNAFAEFSRDLLCFVINMVDTNGNTALHYAVSHGNMAIVDILISRVTTTTSTTATTTTTTTTSTTTSSSNTSSRGNSRGCLCNVDIRNRAGYTAIMLAALVHIDNPKQAEVVRKLFSIGDIDTRATQAGQTALMLATSHGRVDMVTYLIHAGAGVNLRDEDGSTALMCACEHGHSDIVKLLLAHPSIDPSLTDNDNSTAMSIAMQAGHRDIGVLLYAHLNFTKSNYTTGQSNRNKTKRH